MATEKTNRDVRRITVQRWLTALTTRTSLPASRDRTSPQILAELGVQPSDARGRLRLGEKLGSGGFTVVRSGVQISLGRDVAVKCLKEDHAKEAALSLLREAWILGALEHPNIIPVHDLHIDDAGFPKLVLRRIEGTDWGELFSDFDTLAQRLGVVDHLEWNLDVLMQVCSAAHYAHSRSIIHRDIKPENVMIGQFGEVYLVDWGIALALGEGSWNAVAPKQPELVGTPCYMAPEMLSHDVRAIGPHTDVYLLGATLYEILSGYPPHYAETVIEALSKVKLSDPARPDGVPEELVEICAKALEPEPADRFESAECMRQAIATFRQHRSSRILTHKANRTFSNLVTTISDTNFENLDTRLRAYDLFGECRFGYRVALEQWPDNAQASEALQLATEAMVDTELRHNNTEAAAALLATAKEPSGALARRVENARARQRRSQAEIEALADVGRKMSSRTGQRTRAMLAFCLGLIYTASPIVAPSSSHLQNIVACSVGLVLAAAIGWRLHQKDSASAYNRRLVAILAFVFATQIVMRAGAMKVGLSLHLGNQHEYVLLFTTVAIVSIVFEPKLTPACIGYFAGYLALLAMPGRDRFIDVLCHGLFTINATVIWWTSPTEPEVDALAPPDAVAAGAPGTRP